MHSWIQVLQGGPGLVGYARRGYVIAENDLVASCVQVFKEALNLLSLGRG